MQANARKEVSNMAAQRWRLLWSVSLMGLVAACGGPPKVVKYTIKPAHIKALPADALVRANQEKKAWLEAEERYRQEKAKLRLRKLDYELAKLWYKAAKLRVKKLKAALKLRSKKVPVKVAPGALNAALADLELAKKNLTYRKLLYKFYKKRLKLFRWEAYVHKARYMEELAMAIHAKGLKFASKYPKSRFQRQSAKLKLKLATIQEKVERWEEELKALKQEIESKWGPTLRKPPAPPAGPQPAPQVQHSPRPQAQQ